MQHRHIATHNTVPWYTVYCTFSWNMENKVEKHKCEQPNAQIMYTHSTYRNWKHRRCSNNLLFMLNSKMFQQLNNFQLSIF